MHAGWWTGVREDKEEGLHHQEAEKVTLQKPETMFGETRYPPHHLTMLCALALSYWTSLHISLP